MTSYELLPDTTRVWIYQSNRPFNEGETQEITRHLTEFATQWVSHNQQLRAFAKLFNERFVVLMVDESRAGASGCSIDSSVNFIKRIEGHYGVDFFDRMIFAYELDGQIKTASREDFARLYANGLIHDDTLVFDNLVKTKEDFDRQWKKRLADSWHKRFV